MLAHESSQRCAKKWISHTDFTASLKGRTVVYLDMGFWGIAGAPDKEGNAAPQYVNITDETGFAGAIILGVIKNYAMKEKMGIIASPSYFGKDFFQFLLFPSPKLAICISDNSHSLPFNSQNEINISRFYTDKSVLTSKKVKTLISVENSLLYKGKFALFTLVLFFC